MKKFLLAVSIIIPTIAFAESPSYSYGEISYLRAEESGEDVDGVEIVGSAQFTENYFVQASYWDLDEDGFSLSRTGLGVGGILDASDMTNFYGLVRWVDWDVDAGSLGSGSEDGWGAAVGVRSNVTMNLELNAEIAHESVEELDALIYGVGAVYTFTESFAGTARIGKFDVDSDFDFTEYRLGVRLSF